MPKATKGLRPLGRITDDMEKILLEMVDQHEMQMGEILHLIAGYLEVHRNECKEVYTDNSSPVFQYKHYTEVK